MKSFVLPPLSLLYGAITRTRLSLYRRGTFHTTTLDLPVISVGNITVGGTGKTPLVEWVARTLYAEGESVCILTRGYGRKDPHLEVIVSDGYGVLATPAESGDEPYLLATKLAGQVAVISSANRVEAAKTATNSFGPSCFVLDDGFQHLRLARDLNIVTIDATNPWGGGHLLPFGRLRETPESLGRADCVVITRCDQVDNIDDLREEISQLTGGRPIFPSRMRTSRVSGLKNSAETLKPGISAGAFCAVGNPSSFFEQLRLARFEVPFAKSFPDHHIYSQDEIDALVRAAKDAGVSALITTAKDAVKLRTMSFSMPCYVLEIEMCIDNSHELTRLIQLATKKHKNHK